MSVLHNIRDNNQIQPNRFFSISGDVRYIEIETEYTKVILGVFSYYDIGGKIDEIVIFFKGKAKKTADVAISPKCHLSVMGDIVIADGTIFFNGKIFEVFKSGQYATNENTRFVDSGDTNYDRAY